MRSIELFAGCGGLALGLARAGFEHELVVDVDPHAISTLTENKRRGIDHVKDWLIAREDVRSLDYSDGSGEIALVAGGPPCQPFSVGGKHIGPDDERNMWPEAVRAIRELRPKAFLFENVRGLLRPAFADYLDYLVHYLGSPEIAVSTGEHWTAHHRRLQRLDRSRQGPPTYRVLFVPINTADYGAPQQRLRVIAIGVRTDVSTTWECPRPTHSREALLWSKYVSCAYWLRHPTANGAGGESKSDHRALHDLLESGSEPAALPWRTVRDAISDLPAPVEGSAQLSNHKLRPGARAYPRHTGSHWDWPAKALKAGDHGVPGGENMLALGDGSVRYFTLREMARLQGFPDNYVFDDAWKRPIKQLGNAVPVQVGEAFGTILANILSTDTERGLLKAA